MRLQHLAVCLLVLTISLVQHIHCQPCAGLAGAVFSAVRDSPMRATSPVPYEVILADTADGFDATKTVYTAQSSGFYLFHFSAGVPAFQDLAYYMRNGSSTPNLLQTHDGFSGDYVTSRHDIQYINEKQQLYMSSDFDLVSDSMMQTTWAGIKLDDIMDPTVAFSVARTSNYNVTSNSRPIPFNKLLNNLGQAWDSCNGTRFVAPVQGIYFLAWSSASAPSAMQEVRLKVNGVDRGVTSVRGSNYPGVDTVGTAVMLELDAGDEAQLFLWPGSGTGYGTIFSNANYQTAFSGFLYEPRHANKVAWSLTFPYSSNISFVGTSARPAINFTQVWLNEGDAWDASTASIDIPVDGYYYLFLSGVSWPVGYQFSATIARNGKDEDIISTFEKADNGDKNQLYNTRGRALVTRLNEGDFLTVQIPPGYQSYSNFHEFVFTGFLIEPIEPISSTTRSRKSTPVKSQNTCAIPVTAFSVARTSPLVSAAARVPFNVELVDTSGGFDSALTSYNVSLPGFYFMHTGAGVPGFQRLKYALRGAASTPNVILTHQSFDGELVMSRDDIQYLGEGQTIYMSTDYPLYSDSMMQTTWSGFRLDEVMNPLVLFRAAKTTNHVGIGTISLDSLTVNVGGAWNPCTNQFVAPIDGIYFFSWSSASVVNTTHSVSLRVGNINRVTSGIMGGNFNGNDVSSQATMLYLTAGSQVTLHLSTGTNIYSDINYQTSLVGFLYEPTNAQKVAWSLSTDAGQLLGPLTVSFDVTLVNEGGAWNTTSPDLVTIPVTGTYYIVLSGGTSLRNYKLNMAVLVNGELLFNIIEKVTTRTSSYNVRSQALIVSLRQGDILQVGIPAGYNTVSTNNELMFVGFLLS